MLPNQRIVLQTPLAELWQEDGALPAIRERDLSLADVKDLLRSGPVQFIIADVGKPLVWVDIAECFTFWRSELRERIAQPTGQGWYVGRFLGGHAYRVSQWTSSGLPLVLLEAIH